MNRKEKFVITISRQFGTGGHEIGAEIARRLGVKLLDKQILNEVAKRTQAVEDAMEKIEARNPLWRDDFTNFYRNYMAKAEYDGAEQDQTSHELFEAQCQAIKMIAQKESCVIVGRCGFYIFKDHPNALKIFVHSTEECRKRRIAEKYGLDLRDAAAMVVDNDYSRELYTKTFTGCEWFDARNYDVSLDVRKFGINGAVDFLMNCIE
ncbi:MAG: cytidylate kinase-like family protein [Prevotella ruminicola]|jgi:cytidylate kinase|uniref:Cytidylate kinase-like family protein n=1 Tax=Xylanibacter ruminicola TaxID=839 RepID=A0A9D5NXV9_XYLRU|nr:cytidylate kinase-like family protein [Xylanibacter ruminicola]